MQYRRGRLPTVHTQHTMRRALALAPFLDALGTPPVTCSDYVSAVLAQSPGGWPMYMNGPDPDMPAGVPPGGLGDCTIADGCHQIMVHTANAGTIVIPTNLQALTAYEAQGYQLGNSATDQGCDETSVCDYLMSTGIAGQKSAGTGMIDPTNINHIKWCVQIFGACRIGVIVDDQMEQDFDNGQPWTVAADPNDPNAGGHDPPIMYYDSNYAYISTWGNAPRGYKGLQPVAWELIANAQFMDEAHAEVWPDFCNAGGTAPNGFDLSALLAKLALIQT